MLAVAAFGLGALVYGGRPLLVAGGLVELALCIRWLVIRGSVRDVCLAMISRGEGQARVESLVRARVRLDSPRHRDMLASSLEAVIRILDQRPARVAASRPLFRPWVVRPFAPELRAIAELLRSGGGVRGVAVVERLLTSGESPLYGRDLEPLRIELRRARYLLEADWPAALSTRSGLRG